MSADTLKPGDRVQCGNRCWEGKGTVLAVVKDVDVLALALLLGRAVWP